MNEKVQQRTGLSFLPIITTLFCSISLSLSLCFPVKIHEKVQTAFLVIKSLACCNKKKRVQNRTSFKVCDARVNYFGQGSLARMLIASLLPNAVFIMMMQNNEEMTILASLIFLPLRRTRIVCKKIVPRMQFITFYESSSSYFL